MKAVAIEQFGGVEAMHWANLPTPHPESQELQIEIAATSVNPVDWKIREGKLKNVFPFEFPLIPGWDASGIVSDTGADVSGFSIGDEVFCYCRKPTVQWGTYAEYVCVDAKHTALKPKNLNFSQAASIPLASLTAWQGLFDEAKLKKDQTVLIHAGAGGVGSMAIQLAKAVGAKVFTTASTPKHGYVKSLGAAVAIDYKKENFVEKIRESEPEGLDVVLDCVGNETLDQSFEVVKPGGHLISIVNKVDSNQAQEKNIQGSLMIVRPDGEQLQKIATWIEEGKIKVPHITELPLSEYAKAHQMSQAGHTKGKIVLKVKED